MSDLQQIVDDQVDAGRVPGAVAVRAEGDHVTVAAGGHLGVGRDPMPEDALFRISSLTKPLTAAATMVLVERGRFALDDPVAPWLSELAEPSVLRTPDADLDDVVPAVRPVTVRHLLTLQGGHGVPAHGGGPVVRRMAAERLQGPPRPQEGPSTDEWLARLGRLPLLHQPGEGWTYDTGSDVLGVLLARAGAAPLGDVLADALLEPLGMADTAFWVQPGDLDRLATLHARADDGTFAVVDPPDGQWAAPPPRPSGAGGLVSTAADWLAFARMLLAGGEHRGRRVLSEASVRLMTTSHVEAEPDNPFLQGHGWGFGGSVDLAATDPWNVPGRYGWVGGTGTAGYVVPARGTAMVWLGQVEMGGPDDFEALAAFLTWATASRPG